MSLVARILPFVVLTLISLSPSSGFALGTEEFGNKELHEANYTSWPGILTVINNKARVYQVWVNGHENFQFKGTTGQFNETLQHFARLEGVTQHEVVVRVGPGHGSSFNAEQKFAVDWDLEIYAGISAHVVSLDQGAKVWSKDPVLTVYVSDEFKLSDIVFPDVVTVTSPNQLGKRIAEGILASKDVTVRGWGCGQLASVSPYDTGNLDVVGKMLSDTDNWVRLNATSSVAVFGKKSEKFLPQLRELAKSDDESLRKSSEQAIKTIEIAGDTSDDEARHNSTMAQINDYIRKRSDKNPGTK